MTHDFVYPEDVTVEMLRDSFGIMCTFFLMFSLYLFRHDFGEGNGIPLQYSCLENPMDGGAW